LNKFGRIFSALIAVAGLACAGAFAGEARLIEARKIWDAAPHNAFTDLTQHNGELLCVFREGSGHVSADGKIRVIVSKDGASWASAALIADARS
jgi:hypothetical protein